MANILVPTIIGLLGPFARYGSIFGRSEALSQFGADVLKLRQKFEPCKINISQN